MAEQPKQGRVLAEDEDYVWWTEGGFKKLAEGRERAAQWARGEKIPVQGLAAGPKEKERLIRLYNYNPHMRPSTILPRRNRRQVFLGVVGGMALAGVLFGLTRLVGDKPKTLTPQWKAKSEEKRKANFMDPISRHSVGQKIERPHIDP